MMRIPYVDLSQQHRALEDELLVKLRDVLRSGKFILGPEVDEFEQHFAQLCNVRHALGVNSGTDALILALRSLGIGVGDEVITAPNSFITTATSIIAVGAKPVFVDVADDYNIDVDKVVDAITPNTKAILPVHLTGNPCRMDALVTIAEQHNLLLIEDCAQAVCAQYQERMVGSFGEAGCFSFHPLKTLNACGDGGAVVTNNNQLYERLLRLRNNGMQDRARCQEWSANSRLDSLQAAILTLKLEHIEAWTAARIRNANFYREALGSVAQICLPIVAPQARAVYHTFVIRAERRDALQEYLREQGIGTAIHYPLPIHLQDCAKALNYKRGDFPIAEQQAQSILTLPIYPELTEQQLSDVVAAIKTFYVK